MTFFKWSKTAANNGTADSTCPFPEGMSASALNDGTRGMMAAAAKYRDDISGAIATSGTSTAYAVFSNQGFDALLSMSGQMVAFTPHATNGDAVTLNVDSLGAKPLRSSPGVDLPSGTLILGTPYVALYNYSDAVWYLHGGLSNPYNIPLGGMMEYTGPTAPNSAFVLPFGQAISRTAYAAYWALVGTTYGPGDGSTTFNVIDKRGRVSAGVDNMGGSGAGQFTGVSFASGNSTTPGSKLGSVVQTIGQSQLPNVTLPYSGAASVDSSLSFLGSVSSVNVQSGGTPIANGAAGTVHSTGTSSGNTSSINGNVTQAALPTVQPTILTNYILRII